MSESALDLLWATPEMDLANLLKCLPSGSVFFEPTDEIVCPYLILELTFLTHT